MRGRVTPLLVLTMTAVLAACSGGGGASAAPPATEAPASQAPASEAPVASEPAGGAAGGGCAPSTEAGVVEVDIQNFAYSPAAVEAAVGETITFTNRDEAPHTATLDEGDCSTESLGQDATGGLVFDAAGTYPFHCRIHPNMTGTITVTGAGSVSDGY